MNSSVISDVIDGHDTANLVESIIKLEWNQFQQTNNEGGRASCQGNWPMFHQMRASQFMTWPEELLRSYRSDLQEADRVGRNLVTEKYGRMMQSTYPQEYCANIAPYIPRISANRNVLQEGIITVQVSWARDFRERFPHLGEAMRVLTLSKIRQRPRRSKRICAANWAPIPTVPWRCTAILWSVCGMSGAISPKRRFAIRFVWLDLRIWHRLRPHSKHSENTP